MEAKIRIEPESAPQGFFVLILGGGRRRVGRLHDGFVIMPAVAGQDFGHRHRGATSTGRTVLTGGMHAEEPAFYSRRSAEQSNFSMDADCLLAVRIQQISSCWGSTACISLSHHGCHAGEERLASYPSRCNLTNVKGSVPIKQILQKNPFLSIWMMPALDGARHRREEPKGERIGKSRLGPLSSARRRALLAFRFSPKSCGFSLDSFCGSELVCDNLPKSSHAAY